jgi:hypothetical protein
MKKIMKIGALSLALIASLVLLSNNTNAASTSGNVALKVNTGTSTCVVGTAWNAGSGTASFSSFALTGNINSNFYCTDYDGVYQWNMQIVMQTNLTGSNASSTPIPKAGVSMKAFTNKVTAGSCSTGTMNDTWTNI